MEQVVVLVDKERKSGSKNGRDWFFNVYTDSAGNKFQTGFNESLDVPLNRPVKLTYDIQTRQYQKDGQTRTAENKIVKFFDVLESPDTHEAPPEAPPAQQSTGIAFLDGRQTIINRSAALARAIEAHAAGFAKSASVEQLYRVADEFVRYIEQGSGAFHAEDENIPF